MGAEPDWASALRQARPDLPFRYHETVDSTNDAARRWLDEGGPDGLVVVAGSQVAGRGRRGRSWSSPPGKGLYLSLGLRPGGPGLQGTHLTFLGAVAVAELLREHGVPAEIRWPNDVDVRGRKIAGILAEGRLEGDVLASAVLGIGMNLSHGPEDLPPGAPATCLADEGVPIDRTGLVAGLLHRLDRWRPFLAGGSATLLDRWRALAPGHRGRRVLVEQEGQSFAGVTCGVDPDGALRVEREDGRLTIVHAGELRRVREG